MIIANFSDTVKDAAFMELFMDWWLEYRNQTQMWDLARLIANDHIAKICVDSDESGDMGFLPSCDIRILCISCGPMTDTYRQMQERKKPCLVFKAGLLFSLEANRWANLPSKLSYVPLADRD